MRVRTSQKSKTISFVVLDEAVWGILPNRMLLRLNIPLHSETELAELQANRLIEELEKQAWERFLKYLAYRERSLWECQQFLKNLPLHPSLIPKLIEQAEKYNYISDQRFAEIMTRSMCEYGKSKQEISNKLYEKRISPQLIEKYLNEYYYTQEEQILQDNLKKALARYSRFPQKERIEKLKNYLYRKGFSYSKIMTALAKMELEK
ncbi:MAG: RecX family transcriptional regulator [Candidatus Cloacimonadales bacterium]